MYGRGVDSHTLNLNVRLGGPQNGHLPPCSAFENLNRFKYFLFTLDKFPIHNVIESKNRILKSLKCKQEAQLF